MPEVFNAVALGIVTSLVLLLLPIALVAVAVPYAVMRMRDVRGEHHDPQLGLKVAYHFFFSLGILLILIGLTVNVADLIIDEKPAAGPQFGVPVMPVPVRANPKTDGRFLTPAMRTGWALASSGLVFSVVFGLAPNSARTSAGSRRYGGSSSAGDSSSPASPSLPPLPPSSSGCS